MCIHIIGIRYYNQIDYTHKHLILQRHNDVSMLLHLNLQAHLIPLTKYIH